MTVRQTTEKTKLLVHIIVGSFVFIILNRNPEHIRTSSSMLMLTKGAFPLSRSWCSEEDRELANQCLKSLLASVEIKQRKWCGADFQRKIF